MTRTPFNVGRFKPSPECVQKALDKFKEGKPLNCIQTAHLAEAAFLWLQSQNRPNYAAGTTYDIYEE